MTVSYFTGRGFHGQIAKLFHFLVHWECTISHDKDFMHKLQSLPEIFPFCIPGTKKNNKCSYCLLTESTYYWYFHFVFQVPTISINVSIVSLLSQLIIDISNLVVILNIGVSSWTGVWPRSCSPLETRFSTTLHWMTRTPNILITKPLHTCVRVCEWYFDWKVKEFEVQGGIFVLGHRAAAGTDRLLG